MAKLHKPRGFRDVSAEGQRRFTTERGDVQIREVDPRGWDWDVLPLGGAARHIRGMDAAITEARQLSRASPEWRRGDLAGEDAAREGLLKHGRAHVDHGLRDLRQNLHAEARRGEAEDFDRGYVVGYERGSRGGGAALAGRVDPGFVVDYSPGRTYPRSASAATPVSAPSRREIEKDVAGIMGEGDPKDRLFMGVGATGIVYADKKRQRHGDYLTLARLPYRTLELEWEPGVPVTLGLREAIERDARLMQARRGQRFSLSSTGNVSVVLGE